MQRNNKQKNVHCLFRHLDRNVLYVVFMFRTRQLISFVPISHSRPFRSHVSLLCHQINVQFMLTHVMRIQYYYCYCYHAFFMHSRFSCCSSYVFIVLNAARCWCWCWMNVFVFVRLACRLKLSAYRFVCRKFGICRNRT